MKTKKVRIMKKYGNINENTKSDFDNTKTAEFFDKEGFELADKANKEKLAKPSAIKKNK